jgi:hypothetical protein
MDGTGAGAALRFDTPPRARAQAFLQKGKENSKERVQNHNVRDFRNWEKHPLRLVHESCGSFVSTPVCVP